MSQLIINARRELRDIILSALSRAVSDGEISSEPIPDFTVSIPQNKSFGDYATNAAMVASKALKKNPRELAEIIISKLSLDGTSFENASIAGPGFINFTLADRFWADTLNDVLKKGSEYGKSKPVKDKKVLLEFVSANPTGPMHIGNARGGALGDCLASVMDFAGYSVSREFYVNDAGNQIDKFALSLATRYMQIFDPTMPFPEEGYQGEDIKALAMEFADKHGDIYKSDFDLLLKDIVDFALPKNIAALKSDLLEYRIEYDRWFCESEIHENGELAETIELLKSKNLTYEKDGALWYKATDHGGEKDEVLIRANGNSTYFAADIAYHRNKFLRGFDLCINVWGADHHGHVARMKGAMEALGFDPNALEIALMQMVRLVRNGETVRVSKRTGKSITLKTLLEEVPVDAARFLFNLRESGTQFDFDLELAVQKSNENPVYYVQYAHARICSIIRNLKTEGIVLGERSSKQLMLLNAPEERELIRFISIFTDEIISAAKEYEPSKITRYLVDLATHFHKFYSACRVKGEEQDLAEARLSLCSATKITLANAMKILNINAPEQM